MVLLSGQNAPDGGKSCWGSGFLPSTYQGVEFRRSGDPVLFLSNPDGMSSDMRRRSLDLLKTLNTTHQADAGDPEIESRIRSYEMAYKMQFSVPELAAISRASPPKCTRCTARSRERTRLRTTACWRGGWWSAVCAWFSFTIADGTLTARRTTKISSTSSPSFAATPIRPPQR